MALWRVSAAVSAAGSSTMIVVPDEAVLFSARIVPRCASTMLRQIANPSPEPLGLVVKKGSKTWLLTESGMPGPVSETSTKIQAEPEESVLAIRMVSSPPCPIASSAFWKMLRKSCFS